jgi:hypothetical protein
VIVASSLLAAAGLAAVHLFSNVLRVFDGVPRSRFLSIAGGMSVAFVILRLLPGLSAGQQAIEQTAGMAFLGFLEHHVYIIVLLSLIVFYGLERLARSSQERNQAAGTGDVASQSVFWLHLATFAVMNGLIGYLLVNRAHRGWLILLLFFIAMLLKFIVNDHSLHRAYQAAYDQIGRWILAAVVFVGVAIGLATTLPPIVPALLQAFLAGGVLLNVLKEELPSERKSRFWAFALGASLYAAFLILVASIEQQDR